MLMKRKMSDGQFKAMQGLMKLIDTFYPYVKSRARSFGVQPGMTVVDYGCGPGRYTAEFAKLVGENGKVFAVDHIDIALRETRKRLDKTGAANVELKLAKGYDSGIPARRADIVCAIDMFHHVEPVQFLKETERIAKPDGVMIIAGGHMFRSRVKAFVAASGLWEVADENFHFLTYRRKLTK